MALEPIPPPYYTPPLQGRPELISSPWFRYFSNQATQLTTAAQAIATKGLAAQAASISATPLLVTSFSGLFRVTYYLRITQAATVSSSVTVTIGFTETAVPLTKTFPAVTGNTTTTIDSQTWLLRSDAAAPITYAITYASVGATAMQYRIDVVVEQLA